MTGSARGRLGFAAVTTPHGGGVHQYAATMLAALERRWPTDELVVFADDAAYADARARGVDARRLEGSRVVRRLRRVVPRPDGGDGVRQRPHVAARVRRADVRLLVVPAPHPLGLEIGMPFVAPVHDLQHRLQAEWPEVSAGGEAERRELLFRRLIPAATTILVDSEVGREDVLSLYGDLGIAPERVRVLPFAPSALLPRPSDDDRASVRDRYGLPERFLFYPAHFWPHKNHARLAEAVALARRVEPEVGLVLVGGATGPIPEETRRAVLEVAGGDGEKGVHVLGYVPDRDVAALYCEAVALVMPTFFGPTNIPILEAWSFGCPVVTSDIRGVREQAGDAALLVDPRAAEDIAGAITRIWRDHALAADLVRRGTARLDDFGQDAYEQRLLGILDDALERVA